MHCNLVLGNEFGGVEDSEKMFQSIVKNYSKYTNILNFFFRPAEPVHGIISSVILYRL